MPSQVVDLGKNERRLIVSIGAGGLNTRLPSTQIQDWESPDCKNVLFQDGKVVSRYGYAKMYPTGQPLSAGKGVIVAQSKSEAKKAVDLIMKEKAFGAAGKKVVKADNIITLVE